MRRAFFCLLIVALLTASCANRFNMWEGIASFNCQDYRKAFIRLKPEAEKGNPDAQYAVGYMYYYGQGVVENREKAVEWIATAAKCGQPDAIKALAMVEKPRLKNGEYALN